MKPIYIARHNHTEHVIAWGTTRESLEAALTACRIPIKNIAVDMLSGQSAVDFVQGQKKF